MLGEFIWLAVFGLGTFGSMLFWGPAPTRSRVWGTAMGGIVLAVATIMVIGTIFPKLFSDDVGTFPAVIVFAVAVSIMGRRKLEQSTT